MAAEDGDHVCGVHSVPAFGSDSVDGGSICDLGSLNSEVDGESLDDWSRDCVFSCVGPDDDAGETVAEPEDDTEQWDEAVDDRFGIEGAEYHSADTYESEETDCDGVVGVWWGRKEKCESRPVARECRGG